MSIDLGERDGGEGVVPKSPPDAADRAQHHPLRMVHPEHVTPALAARAGKGITTNCEGRKERRSRNRQPVPETLMMASVHEKQAVGREARATPVVARSHRGRESHLLACAVAAGEGQEERRRMRWLRRGPIVGHSRGLSRAPSPLGGEGGVAFPGSLVFSLLKSPHRHRDPAIPAPLFAARMSARLAHDEPCAKVRSRGGPAPRRPSCARSAVDADPADLLDRLVTVVMRGHQACPRHVVDAGERYVPGSGSRSAYRLQRPERNDAVEADDGGRSGG